MNKRVLLAEDEPNIIEVLDFLLTRAGFQVESAMDGLCALDYALTKAPDVMVLDVMLPGIDGFTVLKRLRKDQRGANLPVIMLTAKGQIQDRKTAHANGANLFITKPFANNDVVRAVCDLAGDAS